MKIFKPQRNLEKLSLQEYGLLCYIKASLDNDGLFQQQLSIAADTFGSTKPTVHRLIKNLIGKNYLKVIRKSRRGEDGWFIPAVLQPIPPVKPIENKQSPIPFGTLEAMTSCRPNRMSVVCYEPDKHVALHQADEMEQARRCPCGKRPDSEFSAKVHEALPVYLPDTEWCGTDGCVHSKVARKEATTAEAGTHV